MRNRPGKLTAVCVLAIVLGVMGLMSGLMRAVALVAGTQMNQAVVGTMPGQQAKLQGEMMTKMQAVGDRWKIATIPITIAHLAISGCLLAGGVLTLQDKPGGRRLLAGAMLAAIVFELAKAVPEGMIQLETQAVSKEYLGQIMAAGPQGGDAAAFGSAMGSAMMIVTLGILVIWTLIKLGFYLIGVSYLRKPEVRALFDPAMPRS